MLYSNDAKTKINIYELNTKYIADVDPRTSNVILVSKEKASELSEWNILKAPGGL
jgi:hypothetical protein